MSELPNAVFENFGEDQEKESSTGMCTYFNIYLFCYLNIYAHHIIGWELTVEIYNVIFS